MQTNKDAERDIGQKTRIVGGLYGAGIPPEKAKQWTDKFHKQIKKLRKLVDKHEANPYRVKGTLHKAIDDTIRGDS